MVKRGVDILLSAVLLLLVSPILLLSAAIVAITSPGPVIFQQTRIGRGFRPFTLFKLRTMAHNAPGLEYTLGDDPRITPFGRWLRSTKIDELPQLWNVLRGEMSLVGPRPVIPGLTEEFRIHYRLLLRGRPGLTDPASLKYRQETKLLQQATDREEFFKFVVTPDKINISLAYMEAATMWTDLGLLLMTAAVCMIPSLSRLYGRAPRPLIKPAYQEMAMPEVSSVSALPLWSPTDTSLLPQPADYSLADHLRERYGQIPLNLLPSLNLTMQSSINRRDGGVSSL
jgi:lipopolysaccharide/colanic/teichoic acid biosynthesis glycosyltransferase